MLASLLLYLGTSAAPDTPAAPWWEAWTGILAIPAAVLAIPMALKVIRKTNLDARKTELEIEEKEQALRAAVASTPSNSTSTNIAQIFTAPLIESRRVQEIILRFITLYLALVAWGFVSTVIDALGNTASMFGDYGAYIIGSALIGALPQVGYYLLVLGIGGPLFVEICRHLNTEVPRFLRFVERPKRSTFVAVGLVVFIGSALYRLPQILDLFDIY